MIEITNRTKRLVAELTVLMCIVYAWNVKSETYGIDDVKAGVLKQVVKADSDNVDAYRFLGDYYMDSGSYEKAVDVQRQIVRIDPNDAYAHSMLGDAYYQRRLCVFQSANASGWRQGGVLAATTCLSYVRFDSVVYGYESSRGFRGRCSPSIRQYGPCYAWRYLIRSMVAKPLS